MTIKKYTDPNGVVWFKDSNNNRCSVKYFGSEEAAQAALASLKNCNDCENCSDCSYCSYCSRCSYCSDCSRCSRCSYCSDCSRCSYCSRCSDCSYCSDCSDCSDCHNIGGEAPPIPSIPDIHKAIYAAVTATPDSLDMETWHSCETTHCRGGWVVTLAGEAGKKLEDFYNTELAAMLIYQESGYEINPAKFYLSNAESLEDMRKLAEGK